MKKIPCFFLSLIILGLPALTQAEGGQLDDSQRAELVNLLERSRTELERLAAQAVGENWNWKPAADQWSVGEVVEHIVLAEEGITAMIQGALAGEADPEWQKYVSMDVSQLVTGFQDRSQKFPAPEPFVPKGENNRAEMLARYAKARLVSLDFTRATQAPLDHFTAEAPAGKMNLRQFLGLIAGHNMRHNQQIEEVLETLDKR